MSDTDLASMQQSPSLKLLQRRVKPNRRRYLHPSRTQRIMKRNLHTTQTPTLRLQLQSITPPSIKQQ
jgi:hypothetical protein